MTAATEAFDAGCVAGALWAGGWYESSACNRAVYEWSERSTKYAALRTELDKLSVRYEFRLGWLRASLSRGGEVVEA